MIALTFYTLPLFLGKKPPTGTSFVDLSKNDYSYDVEMQYAVYTNSLFSGVTTMEVKVGSINVDKNGMINESKGISVHLMKSGSTLDLPVSISLNGGTAYFSNLDPDAKYYIRFTKLDDTQIYTFTGTITK